MTDTKRITRNAALLAAALAATIALTGCVVAPETVGEHKGNVLLTVNRSKENGNLYGNPGMMGAYYLGPCNPKDVSDCGSTLVGTHDYYVQAQAEGRLGFLDVKTGTVTMADELAKGSRLCPATKCLPPSSVSMR